MFSLFIELQITLFPTEHVAKLKKNFTFPIAIQYENDQLKLEDHKKFAENYLKMTLLAWLESVFEQTNINIQLSEEKSPGIFFMSRTYKYSIGQVSYEVYKFEDVQEDFYQDLLTNDGLPMKVYFTSSLEYFPLDLHLDQTKEFISLMKEILSFYTQRITSVDLHGGLKPSSLLKAEGAVLGGLIGNSLFNGNPLGVAASAFAGYKGTNYLLNKNQN